MSGSEVAQGALDVVCKRIYDGVDADDGRRVLVERLWPRGMTRAAARLDEWSRDLAPSPTLRKWYGHDRTRWSEFRERYRAELGDHADELERLRELARRGRVTLVFATRDEAFSSAAVLLDELCRVR